VCELKCADNVLDVNVKSSVVKTNNNQYIFLQGEINETKVLHYILFRVSKTKIPK
jgi:hypothetical protein